MTKSVFILLCSLMSLLMVSCNQNNQLRSTPYVAVSYLMVNPITRGDTLVGAEDTLGVRYLADSNLYVLDTLTLGSDTIVRFTASFGSYSNNLTAAYVVRDTAVLKFRAFLNQDILNVLVEPSNPEGVKLFLTPGYNYLSFPIEYRPLQRGTTDFTLVVESDAGEGYSPAYIRFRQPVR